MRTQGKIKAVKNEVLDVALIILCWHTQWIPLWRGLEMNTPIETYLTSMDPANAC
jgi:hypothetical protein